MAKEYWRRPDRDGERFCLFTAYADPNARELGKIYQDVGFIYLGQQKGRGFEYFDLDHPEWSWFNGRRFRQPSQFRLHATANNITWNPTWKNYSSMPPADAAVIRAAVIRAAVIRAAVKAHEQRCVRRPATPKHKYLYIEGRSRCETKFLRRLFRDLHSEEDERRLQRMLRDRCSDEGARHRLSQELGSLNDQHLRRLVLDERPDKSERRRLSQELTGLVGAKLRRRILELCPEEKQQRRLFRELRTLE